MIIKSGEREITVCFSARQSMKQLAVLRRKNDVKFFSEPTGGISYAPATYFITLRADDVTTQQKHRRDFSFRSRYKKKTKEKWIDISPNKATIVQ